MEKSFPEEDGLTKDAANGSGQVDDHVRKLKNLDESVVRKLEFSDLFRICQPPQNKSILFSPCNTDK